MKPGTRRTTVGRVLLAVLVIAVPVGVFIGTIGIGGVLLPPALTWLGGLDIHAAAGTSSWAFLFTGVVGTVGYARQQAMPWRFGGLLALGAAPAAAAGALVNNVVPATVLWLVLGVVTAGSGAWNLWARPRETRELPAPAAVVVGAVVGFGSALTGTGGPVLLVPVLLALGVPALTTIAAGQLIQIPLVGFATIGYAAQGNVHFGLGSVLGVLAGAGALAGTRLAPRLRGRLLHRVVSAALVAFGGFLFVLPFLPR
ncbi:sulfite exporter TauE/SafE family protein [Amycolatopsis sp. NPDC051758]|uniref:sulfite exporter TauE/SafE family protein n=1 Tax=Amycolatopsis sp. NPDC051758 TaxID=3363935 RepID=UPI0037B57FDD